MKEQQEWTILIALFKATVEQQSMLIGKSKQDAKVIFNRWLKDGNNLLKLIEKNSSEKELEEVTFVVEQSINRLRKKKLLNESV
jgi:hypothetical protein